MNQRRVVKYIVGLLIFVIALSGSVQAAQRHKKPQSPVQIALSAAQTGLAPEAIKPGDIVDFIVTVSSSIDADEMNISVTLPRGAELTAGALDWRGPSKRNEKTVLTFSAKAPNVRDSIIRASVIIPMSGGASFSASTQYPLGVQSKKKAEPSRPVKKDRKGKDVIEYQ